MMPNNFFIYLLIVTLITTHYVQADLVYVGNYGNNTVSVIDTTTNTVIGLVSDPDNTFNDVYYIAVNPTLKTAYVINRNGSPNTISIIDTTTNTVTGVITGPFTSLYSLTVSPDGSKIYAVDDGSNSIQIISAFSNTYLQTIDDTVHPFSGPFFLVTTPDGETGYVANDNDNTIAIVDLAHGVVTGVVSDPGSVINGPFALTITPDGKTVYVANFTSGVVNIINVVTNTITGQVSDPDHTMSDIYYILASPDSTKVYADNFPTNNNTISVISTATNAVTAVINNVGLEDIYYFAITPDSKTMYTANYGNSTVSIVDLLHNTVTGTVSDPSSTFASPYSLAILGSPPQSPTNVKACFTANVFLTQTDLISIITWSAPTSGTVPVSYKIYRDAALTNLAGTIPANGTLRFIDHNQIPNAQHYIVSVDQFGNASQPVMIMTTSACS